MLEIIAVIWIEVHLQRTEQCGSENIRDRRIFGKEIRNRPQKNEHAVFYGMPLISPKTLGRRKSPSPLPGSERDLKAESRTGLRLTLHSGFIPKESGNEDSPKPEFSATLRNWQQG